MAEYLPNLLIIKLILNKLKQILLFFVAMQILNTGLFAQDFTRFDDGQNVINSATEYIAEIILNKVDTFPEHQQHHNTHHKHSHSFLLKIQQYILFKHTPSTTFLALVDKIDKNEYAMHKSIRLESIVFDITPPPPKA